MFLTHRISAHGSILLCLLEDVSLPLMLADLRYADFRSEFGIGLAQLWLAIGETLYAAVSE